MEAIDQSGKAEVEFDKEKMLVVLSIFILSGKTEIIEPATVVEKLVQIFNEIIIGEDYKVSSSLKFACLVFFIKLYFYGQKIYLLLFFLMHILANRPLFVLELCLFSF